MEEQVSTRRPVLRGALASGCCRWTPLVPAADAQKQDPATPAKPVAAPAKKVSQASVRYQSKPKGEQQCSKGMNFIAESNTCRLVEGTVSPEGWCTLWVKKA